MSESIFQPEHDSRSTEELFKIALTGSIDDETGEDGFPIITPATQARFVLEQRATRDVLETASKLCASGNSNERRIAAKILGELGIPERAFPDECLQVLLGLLEHPDYEVVQTGGLALGNLRHPGAIPFLTKLKSHPDSGVRYSVAIGLLTYEDELAVQTLIELSEDEDEDVRDWATFGLGTQIELDTPEIRETLFKRLDDTGNAQGEAMVGLARRKDDRVLAPLLRALAWELPSILIFEAAQAYANPNLNQALIDLKIRNSDHSNSYWSRMLDDAIAACAPKI
jgi:HEAT repeat protein